MSSLKLHKSKIGIEKADNCKFTADQILHLLLLFPLFMVKDAYSHSISALGKMFRLEKDTFYRFMRNDNINWRGQAQTKLPSMVSCTPLFTIRMPMAAKEQSSQSSRERILLMC